MWTRKSPLEIAAQDRRARIGPIPAILWTLLISALTFLADVGGGWYYAPWRPTLSASPALEHAAVVSAAVFIIVYVAQLIFGGWWLRPDHEVLLCPRCGAVKPKKRTDLFVRRAARATSELDMDSKRCQCQLKQLHLTNRWS